MCIQLAFPFRYLLYPGNIFWTEEGYRFSWRVMLMEILPGSSGGPVFDREGNFVGMVKGRFRGAGKVGFLIPLETIIEFVKTALL